MEDKTLMRLSLAIALIGLAALTIATQVIEPRQIKIGEIGDRLIGQNVEVAGAVKDIAKSDGNVFFTLDDGSSVKIVIFERAARNMPELETVKNGKNVSVTGKIGFYRSELEITASKIKVL